LIGIQRSGGNPWGFENRLADPGRHPRNKVLIGTSKNRGNQLNLSVNFLLDKGGTLRLECLGEGAAIFARFEVNRFTEIRNGKKRL
jgi:hypothetical protein